MECFVQGILECSGGCNFAEGYLDAENPKTRKASYEPRLLSVSLNIETSISNGNILSIEVDSDDARKIFLRPSRSDRHSLTSN